MKGCGRHYSIFSQRFREEHTYSGPFKLEEHTDLELQLLDPFGVTLSRLLGTHEPVMLAVKAIHHYQHGRHPPFCSENILQSLSFPQSSPLDI
jgi:hypothetical protein